MPMAMKYPEVIGEYLQAELRAHRVLGPVVPEVAGLVQVNRIGLVPKAHQPDKWRLIVDLSFVIGGVEPEVCSLHYTSVDEACRRVVAYGRGAILAKFDVMGAF